LREVAMNYDARLLERERVGNQVMILRVEKPGEFSFFAGQYCFLTVPDIGLQDDRGLRRAFSIASSPLEKDLLFVVKKSDSALKRTVEEIPIGTIVTVGPPVGTLVLPRETTAPFVFLAGGIGIAPFRSLIRYVTDAGTGHRITLFYSSQVPEETPFLEELQHIPEANTDIGVVVTMTRIGESRTGWTGSTSRINPEMIRDGCESWENAMYYIVGPPAMAKGMQEMLEAMGIPISMIKMELFTGY
jgi:ferredoxin-NADP reductase